MKRLPSISIGRLACRSVAPAMVGTVLTACGSWRGIANVPIPGGRGTAAGRMTIDAQMPDTLALNVLIRHVGAWRLPAELVMARQPEAFVAAAVGAGAAA